MVQELSRSFDYGNGRSKKQDLALERQDVRERLALGFRVLAKQQCGE